MERKPSDHFPTDEEMKDIVAEAFAEPVPPLTPEQLQREDKDLFPSEIGAAGLILEALDPERQASDETTE